ncbi:prephenate dehydrogenase [Effusibacillus dendaii]|uniref:Prephenate dehydrogenase n=1 Tax=Effusibacillus dendaii TaxID=2743772 RepID=A0A7I8D5K5_9BACL|nr:prephenate dehydrogenase [Effusibacillus dendaii]BCJ85404.1 prephenate dehydrogenase [Effusibacillus dendaii]
MIHFNKIAIVGCGLIGGSLALSLRLHGVSNQIHAVDVDRQGLQQALSLGVIDHAADSLEELVTDADLIILAVPVQQAISLLEKLAELPLKKGCIVTDAASTKKEICEFAHNRMPEGISFIGGHPMAGSERTGVLAASPRLFENAVYVLTPSPGQDPIAVETLRKTFEQIRAHVLFMDPLEHDRITAAVSHVPHLVAGLLVDQVADLDLENRLYSQLAAGGFRDVTRIASGSPVMWRDIVLTNKEPILQLLKDWNHRVAQWIEWIESTDVANMESFFTRTRDWRDALPAKAKGAAANYYEIALDVEDKPGIIANVTTVLGQHQINLRNITILENREEINGQLLLSFASCSEQGEALRVLQELGYKVFALE